MTRPSLVEMALRRERVLVLAGLGAYIYFVESKKEPAGDEKPKEKVFAALDKAKVKEVAIDNAGGESVRLVKDGEGWKMAAPFAGPADSSAVDSRWRTRPRSRSTDWTSRGSRSR